MHLLCVVFAVVVDDVVTTYNHVIATGCLLLLFLMHVFYCCGFCDMRMVFILPLMVTVMKCCCCAFASVGCRFQCQFLQTNTQ